MIADLQERASRIPKSYFNGSTARFILAVGANEVLVDLGADRLRILTPIEGDVLFRAALSEEDFAALRTARTDVMTLVNTGRITVDRCAPGASDPPLKMLQFVIMVVFSSWYLTGEFVSEIERPRPAYVAGPPLPRIAAADTAAFFDHARAGRPMMIDHLADNWEVRRRGLDHLLKSGGGIKVSLLKREHGAQGHAAYETSTLSDYVRSLLLLTGEETDYPYLAANAVPPELERMIEPPHFFKRGAFANTRMWIGPPATGLDLHRDMIDNFIVQIHGRKRVWLTAPHLAAALSPQPLGGNPLYQPSGHRHQDATLPAAAAAAAFDVILEEGDTLYLPAGWWHRVHNETLSWSFNFFAVNQRPFVLGLDQPEYA